MKFDLCYFYRFIKLTLFMKKTIYLIGSIFSLSVCASCGSWGGDPDVPPAEIDGWAPIYSDQSTKIIKSVDAQPIEKGGKIYTKGNMLYQVEEGKGIHVIDISQPSNPQKLKFITVLGVHEMAIKDNYLYANNFNDLVVADIANLADVKEVGRKQSAFSLTNMSVPPSPGFFECVDASKGSVIGWEKKRLQKPKCRLN